MSATPPAVAPSFPGTGSYRRRLLRMLLGQGRALRAIGAAALTESLFTLVTPWLASEAIDRALPEQAPQLLALLAGAVIVAAAYAALAGWIHRRATALLAAHLETACLRGALESLFATPYGEREAGDFGNVNETLAAVGGTVQSSVRALSGALTDGAAVLAALAALAVWFPGLALVTAGVTAVTALVTALLALGEARLAQQTLERGAEQQSWLYFLLSGVPAIRACGASERLLQGWLARLERQAAAVASQEVTRVRRTVALQTGHQLLVLGTTAWLVQEVLRGSVSIGQMMTASMLITNFGRASGELLELVLGLRVLSPHFLRIDALLARADRRRVPAAVPPPRAHAANAPLELDAVWFRYGSDSPWVLKNETLSFAPGTLSVFEAPSGRGKTTVLRLLAGLSKPERGTVSVLGHDPAITPGLVLYLPQQSTLIEASIFMNLRALSGEPLERILAIAELTGLTHLLGELPMGGETPVSASGGNLSAGQRQLVLLTAAFASRRPVLLLDEPTAHLDAAAKQRIRWSELIEERTVVLVEHAR